MSQARVERRAFHVEGAAGSKAQRPRIEWHKFESCQVLKYAWNVEYKEGKWHEMMLEGSSITMLGFSKGILNGK